MTKITITIRTENAAFEFDGEIPRILREIARRIEHGGAVDQKVYDGNGNHVGAVEVTE